jgi:hypothetical protein
MLVAVVAMAASTVLSAQTMRAEISFPFSAGKTVMQPGAYEVVSSAAHDVYVLRNLDQRKGVILLAGPGEDTPQAWKSAGYPVLQFACGQGPCSLSRIWNGSGTQLQRFAEPRTADGRPIPPAMIRMVEVRAK